MRGRKRPNFPLSLIVWEEKLWCHRCAITNITHMCSRKNLSCPKWMNEQHEVYFLAPGFPLLCKLFCFSSSSSSFFPRRLEHSKNWSMKILSYWQVEAVCRCIYLFCLWDLFLYVLIDYLLVEMAIYLFYLVIFYATADSDETITQMFPTIRYGTWSGCGGYL